MIKIIAGARHEFADLLREFLLDWAGTKSALHKRAGRIEIAYTSREELDRLAELIAGARS